MARFLKFTVLVKNKGEGGSVKVTNAHLDTRWGFEHQVLSTGFAGLERFKSGGIQMTSDEFSASWEVCWDNNHTFKLKLLKGTPSITPDGEGLQITDIMLIEEKATMISTKEGAPVHPSYEFEGTA